MAQISQVENNQQPTKGKMETTPQIENIARICHDTNRAYCATLGDDSQMPWCDAPDWQRTSAINGVKFHLEHPDSQPEDSHNNWLEEKRAAGWTYGPVKDPEKKEHPCFMPYNGLHRRRSR